MRNTVGVLKLVPTVLIMLGLYANCSQFDAVKLASSIDTSSSLPGYECEFSVTKKYPVPKTIDEATALINELPKPLSLPCFLSSLQGPLKVYAINSGFSAQPSTGPDSPRIFIFNDNLILSVVPDGQAKTLLEFAEITENMRSIKGELVFPVTQNLSLSAPYDRVKDAAAVNGGTTCRFCHSQEIPVTTVGLGEAYSSMMVVPSDTDRVPASKLKQLADQCQSKPDVYRCAILRYIMWSGQGEDGAFPTSPVN